MTDKVDTNTEAVAELAYVLKNQHAAYVSCEKLEQTAATLEAVTAERDEYKTDLESIIGERGESAQKMGDMFEQIGKLKQERDELKAKCEQERVQLAGCLTAAEGWAKGDNDCKQGDYGWSLAFEKVQELRAEVVELRQHVFSGDAYPEET